MAKAGGLMDEVAFDLDIQLVADDGGQEVVETEFRALERAYGGEADGRSLDERFAREDDIQCDRLGDALEGEVARDLRRWALLLGKQQPGQ